MSYQKECKYGCGTVVIWKGKSGNPGSTGFVEANTQQEHTYNRCQQLKKNKGETWTKTPEQKPKYTREELGSTYTPTDIPKTSQGGLPLDTKRILQTLAELTLQTLVELTKEVRELKEEVKNNVQIDSARYENQMDIIYNRLSKETEDYMKSADKYLKDSTMINHSKIAEDKQNFMQRKRDRTIHDESKEKTFDDSIPDNAEDFAIEQTLKDDEGVIDEE